MTNKEAALVILNYNGYNDLVCLINDLLININKDKYIIIVIDGCSTNDQEKLDDYFLAKGALVNNESFYDITKASNKELLYFKLNQNKGYSYGNNFGLRIAYKLGFDFAFVINPDITIPDHKIFDNAVALFKSSDKIGIIGYKVVLPNGKTQGPFRYKLGWDEIMRNLLFPVYSLAKNSFWYIQKKRNGYISVNCVVGCFVSLNLNHLHSIDYYDERVFLYFEEQIISERMSRMGYITVYNENYYVEHNHLQDLNNNQIFQQSKNYYMNEYLKLSPITIKTLKFARKFYNIIWGRIYNIE